MVKLLSDCERGTEPQGIAVDYCYLFRRQCLSIKYIAIKKVYLVTHCHYETKSTITVNTFDILAHWNENVFVLMKLSSLAALEVVKMTTSSAASD